MSKPTEEDIDTTKDNVEHFLRGNILWFGRAAYKLNDMGELVYRKDNTWIPSLMLVGEFLQKHQEWRWIY